MLTVCAAVLRRGEMVFICDRPAGAWAGYWEFPGGKVGAGESQVQALKREIREELGLAIMVLDQIYVTDYRYPDKAVRLHFYRCLLENDTDLPTAREGQRTAWVLMEQLANYRFLPADADFIGFLRRRG